MSAATTPGAASGKKRRRRSTAKKTTSRRRTRRMGAISNKPKGYIEPIGGAMIGLALPALAIGAMGKPEPGAKLSDLAMRHGGVYAGAGALALYASQSMKNQWLFYAGIAAVAAGLGTFLSSFTYKEDEVYTPNPSDLMEKVAGYFESKPEAENNMSGISGVEMQANREMQSRVLSQISSATQQMPYGHLAGSHVLSGENRMLSGYYSGYSGSNDLDLTLDSSSTKTPAVVSKRSR